MTNTKKVSFSFVADLSEESAKMMHADMGGAVCTRLSSLPRHNDAGDDREKR